jgi:hypothetical protein
MSEKNNNLKLLSKTIYQATNSPIQKRKLTLEIKRLKKQDAKYKIKMGEERLKQIQDQIKHTKERNQKIKFINKSVFPAYNTALQPEVIDNNEEDLNDLPDYFEDNKPSNKLRYERIRKPMKDLNREYDIERIENQVQRKYV